jgi:hypothetical protein
LHKSALCEEDFSRKAQRRQALPRCAGFSLRLCVFAREKLSLQVVLRDFDYAISP